jgi:hypothetical protein
MAVAADIADVVEVVVVSITIDVVTIKTEDEEAVTTTEEVVEVGTMVVVVDTTVTRVATEDIRTFHRRCRTPGRLHPVAPTSFPLRHQAGFRLSNLEDIRAMEAMEVPPAHHLRNVQHGWVMHPHNMADHHQRKQATTAP